MRFYQFPCPLARFGLVGILVFLTGNLVRGQTCTVDGAADTNGDCVVDPLDTGFVQSRFGCDVGSADPNCAAADTNGDGNVDPLDTGFVLSRFGCAVGTGNETCDDADANGDGIVNPLDTGYILSRFGCVPKSGDPDCVAADANQDGIVDPLDTGYIQSRLCSGQEFPTVAVDPVPSPTAATTVTLTGSAIRAAQIEITGGADPAFLVDTEECTFMAEVELHANAVNSLFVTGISGDGVRGAPFPLTVTQDSQPPSVFIDFPANGQELTTDVVDVAGRVSDVLSGFTGLTVTVNGLTADVDVGIGTNGSFFLPALPLELGSNTTTAVATDYLGNTAQTQIEVIRVEIPPGSPQMVVVSGNGQTGAVSQVLSDPIVVRVTNMKGVGLANKLVTFDVTRNDGRLGADANGAAVGVMAYQTFTDAKGEARAFWKLGSTDGCGNNRIEVTSKDILGTTFFCASGAATTPAQVSIGMGNNQRAEAGGPAPQKLRVWVNDGVNGIPGIPVTFTVVSGGGSFNGLSETELVSGVTGHAEVNFTLGPQTGNNQVEATFPGNLNSPATFILYGVKRDPTQPTTLTALVLNNGGQPIQGCECHLEVGGAELGPVFSDLNGQIFFDDILGSGPAELEVNGLTAFHVGGDDGHDVPAGSYPELHFYFILVPNAANRMNMPVLLPPLNPNNAQVFDNTQDAELTVEGVVGLKFIVRAGSMTRADGTIPSPSDPAILSLNQVHADDIPMPLPDGAWNPYAGTLGPAGAKFDPPVEIVWPNFTGLPGGTIANFMSFDHDTNRFEIVATGTVTDDGLSILSDPGVGIPTAGWHAASPPAPFTEDVDCDGCCDSCCSGVRGGDPCCIPSDPCCGVECGFCESCVGGACSPICDAPGLVCCLDGVAIECCDVKLGEVCCIDPDPNVDQVTCCEEGQTCCDGECCDPALCQTCDLLPDGTRTCVAAPVGSPCDDGLACTVGDTCTEDGCSGLGDCSDPACVFQPCDDGDVCTSQTVCLNGACIFFGGACADPSCIGQSCKVNICLGEGICTGVGVCEQGPAEVCSANPVCDGSPCEDADPCTDEGTCLGGACLLQQASCAGGAICNGGPCDDDDGNPCTDGICLDGTCVSTPNSDLSSCEDDDPCTDAGVCLGGACLLAPASCAGGDVCDGQPCVDGDGSPCTIGNCLSGTCIALPDPDAGFCDDGDPCTDLDLCEEGTCKGIAGCSGGEVCDGQPCIFGDNNPCTLNICAGGACIGVPDPDSPPCDDGDPCTDQDFCIGTTCVGGVPSCSGGEACDGRGCIGDSDPCTLDQCSGGACVSFAEADCSFAVCEGQPCLDQDSNECTVAICADGACVTTPDPNSPPCDDGNPCTDQDFCLGATCGGGVPSCSGGAVCDGAFCLDDDSDPCTNGSCLGGVCVSGAIDCISGDPCEESSCNPLTGECEVTGVSCAAGALCDGHECEDEDTDPCTNGFCAGGVCVAGAVTCISGNSCEDSNCNPQTGECEITVLPDGTPCTDGQACTVSDVCTGGVCVGQAEDCSFLNDECNVGVCNVDGVCVTQPANEGGPCDDLDACTNPDTCQNGTCTGVVIPGC